MKLSLKIGDKVYIECDSGMGSGGPSKVTKITTQYDKHTGKPYKVYWCGSHGFHENGSAINPPWAYYLIKR